MNEILTLIQEINDWNEGDRETFVQVDDGSVPFDGTFVFAARQRKIDKLKQLVENKLR